MTPQIEFTIRPAQDPDYRFILETTARVRQPRDIPWRQWEPRGLALAKRDLDAGGANVIDAGALLGFLVVTGEALEVSMLYVKREFRGIGLGLKLLWSLPLPDPVIAQDPTNSWRAWCRHRGIKWVGR